MGKQALEGQRINTFLMPPEELTIIGLDTEDGPEHPLYDERIHLPVKDNFVQLMKLQGFKSTVRVRKNGPRVEVVSGRQRVRTAREANKQLAAEGKEPLRVEVRVEQGTDVNAFGVAIAENQHRQDDGPLVVADKLKRYLDMGRTEDEAAIIFNMTKANVRNLMRLHDLDTSVRRAVERGALSASAAAPLADLAREDQKAELEKLLTSGQKVTTKVAKGAAKRKKNGAEEATVAPGKRLVTKVLKLNKKAGVLSHDFVDGVMWVLGERSSSSIKGLRDLEKQAKELRGE